MSFFLLLLVLSLLFIIPGIFIFKAKRQDKKLLSQPNHSAHSSVVDMTTHPPAPTIDVTLLPNLFQQILRDIEAQFAELLQKNQSQTLNDQTFFTAKKLFYTRLPEILGDYLKLEPHYAKTQVIATSSDMTSFDIVFEQLRSILNFMYQANQSAHAQVVQNLMTNQRYLQSVLSDGTATDFNAINTTATKLDAGAIINYEAMAADCDEAAGVQYMATYVSSANRFSSEFIRTVGRLVYFVSLTQSAIFESLGDALKRLNIQTNLEMEALEKFTAYQLPMTLQQLACCPSEQRLSTEQQRLPDLQTLQTILEDMLDTLDKPLSVPDKLALLQNLHDDFDHYVDQHFSEKA